MNFIREQDGYAAKIPSFNVRGESEVKTFVGGLISLLITGLTLSYAIGKWIELIERQHPVITEHEVPNFYDEDNRLDVSKTDFRIAVATWGRDKSYKDDPRYVKWLAKLIVRDEDDVWSEKILPMRTCTDEDMADFYPIEEGSNKIFESLKENRFKCIDWTDEFVLKGNFNSGYFSSIEFIYLPCNYNNTYYLGSPDTIHDDCIPDL